MIKDVDFIKNKKFATVLGIGGSIRTIKKMCAKKYGITEQYFEYERLSEILKFVRDNKKQGSDLILKVAPERVHTAVPGMIIMNEIAKYVKAEKIIVSNFGIREGYLYNKIKGE
ncbi:MAG: hypothetical protein ATN35_11515 [Epulopiscium sp. Nele67-Bin004]|nr:MAG: hypothetical protein ATN35_11515 [Epulopiscium sp. Nele67-Bin004]